MKQTVHIFAKDARHFWPEITGVLAVTALFAWLYPHTWTPEVHTGPGMNLAQMAALVAALMPVSWWILITRVMQGENLVGDQQWWITKPYEWPQLLAAKVLFLAVFTALPLLIAQWVLLARAGFGVFGHLPGQGYDLLLLGMLLVLPVVALAAATSSFGKLTLTAFGVVVLLIGVFMLFAWMKTDSFSVGAPDYVMDLLFLAVAGAVVFAYARRRVVLMRCLLAAIFVAGIGASYLGYSATRIGEKYPAEGWAGLPLQLTLDSGRTATASVAPKWGGERRIGVSVPVTVTGLSPHDVVNLDAVRVTAQALGGKEWTSRWEGDFQGHLQGGLSQETIHLFLDQKFLEQVQGEPLELHLRFALTQLRAAGTTEVAMAGHDFAVPGLGMCAPVMDFSTPYATGILCRAALREPAETRISVRWSDDGCGRSATDSGIEGGGWTGGVSSEPAELNTAAVWSSHIDLSNSIDPARTRQPGKDPRRFLCPGTPLLFTRYALVRRAQYATTIPKFVVPNWHLPAAAD